LSESYKLSLLGLGTGLVSLVPCLGDALVTVGIIKKLELTCEDEVVREYRLLVLFK